MNPQIIAESRLLSSTNNKKKAKESAEKKNNEHANPLILSISRSIGQNSNALKSFLMQRKLPSVGWSDSFITSILHQLSVLDSNNSLNSIGVGEREGRIYSSLVNSRHFGFAHGIGRSGDISESQPKAPGSSLLYKITHFMTCEALKICGAQKAANACIILPVATGMAILMTLMTLKNQTKDKNKKFVVWPRMDQKSCFKAILAASLIPLIIDNVVEGDEVRTDVISIENYLKEKKDEILCVISTTSCFAPRCADRINEISVLCSKYSTPHIVNNAYGLQSSKAMHLIATSTSTDSRIDAFIQSTDKNFMVPVGGSIIASPSRKFIDAISQNYPGRASIDPILDLFITLLSMGSTGLQQQLANRKETFNYFKQQLREKLPDNVKLLETPHNDISMAISFDQLNLSDPTALGSMLFTRNVSGARVVDCRKDKVIEDDYLFRGFGSHCGKYPYKCYLTVAAAIGMTKADVDMFIDKFLHVLRDLKKKEKEEE